MIGNLLLGLSLLASATATHPQQATTSRQLTTVSRKAMNEIVPGLILVKYSQSGASALAQTAASGGKVPQIVPGGSFIRQIARTGWTLWQIPKATDVRQLAGELRAGGTVAYAEPVNRIYPLLDTPNDGDYPITEDSTDFILYFGDGDPPNFRRLWHLDDTNAEFAWANWPNTWYTGSTKPANAPLLAFVDTGCDMDHPDFINAGGFGTDVAQGGQWVKSLSQQFRFGAVDPTGSPNDTYGHGTHVAGIALAAGNNGSYLTHGVIGLGYNSRGAMLRVIDDGGTGTDADAAAAIFYAADNHVEAINLSIGTRNYSQIFQDAVTYAYQMGSLVVASGNEDGSGGGEIGPIYPAACSGALGVSANGPNWTPATTYSGAGSYVDIAAPGGDVLQNVDSIVIQYIFSTATRNPCYLSGLDESVFYPPYTLNYTYLVGTSMACPMVVGAAGLYYGKFNLHQQDGWSNVRVYRALERSAQGVMGAPYGGWEDYQGYGSLDVYALLTETDSRTAQVGAIEGIVYNNATPISNVGIRAYPSGSSTYFSTTTKADGTYRFEALPPGVYRLTTAPLGAVKTKNQVVVAGSDTTGVDFWAGTFTWDDTPPVVARLQVSNVTSNSLDVRHWAYDPETSIDLMQFRIGTTPGGNDVMGDREVFAENPVVHLTGLTLNSGTTYYLRGHYVDGAGYTTDVTVQFGASGPVNVAPTGYTINRGVLMSGGLPELINSDDLRLAVKTGFVLSSSEAPVTVYVDSVSPTQTVSNMNIRLEAQTSTSNIAQTLDLWDYTTSTWVTVDSRAATSNVDSVVTASGSSPNRFIQSGTRAMRARIRYKASGPVLTYPWQGKMDQVQWQLTP